MYEKSTQEYWSNQTNGRHATTPEDFISYMAKELSIHLGNLRNRTVLEVIIMEKL